MPLFDRTGPPEGSGPMTGRKLGSCVDPDLKKKKSVRRGLAVRIGRRFSQTIEYSDSSSSDRPGWSNGPPE